MVKYHLLSQAELIFILSYKYFLYRINKGANWLNLLACKKKMKSKTAVTHPAAELQGMVMD